MKTPRAKYLIFLTLFTLGCSAVTDFRVPSVRILSPVPGENVGSSTVVIHATARDDEELSRIQVYVDNELYHETTSDQLKITYRAVRLGHYKLEVRAFDRSGNWEEKTAFFFAGIRTPVFGSYFRRWQSVLFDWDDAEEGDAYRMQVSLDSTFSSLLVDTLDLQESEVTFGPLRFPHGLLYWRLRSMSENAPWSSPLEVSAVPCEVSRIDTEGFAQEVVVDERIAYIADGFGGVKIVNIEDPGDPKSRGRYVTTGDTQSVFIEGHLLFLADDHEGLKIVNVTRKNKPYLIGRHDTAAARDVFVKDDIAYVADTHKGLKLFDVSAPERPERIARVDTPGFAWGVFVEDDFAYVADHNIFQVIDLSDPLNGFIAGSVAIPGGWAKRVVKSGNHAYVPSSGKGLRIIDVSDPENPRESGRCLFFDDTRDVAVQDGHAYVADSDGGLRIVDISDPSGPFEVDYLSLTGGAYGLTLKDDYAYVCAGFEGFSLVRIR